MSDVTPQAVWNAQMKDSEIQEQPQAALDVLRPYVEQLPVLLADLLDQPCTFSNLMDAKMRFLRYCLDNDFVVKAVAAMPEEALGFFDRDEMPGMLTAAMEQLVEALEPLVKGALELLKERGVTEDEVMLSEEVGLNDEARSLYESGQLTIGQLLLVQPSIITKNQ